MVVLYACLLLLSLVAFAVGLGMLVLKRWRRAGKRILLASPVAFVLSGVGINHEVASHAEQEAQKAGFASVSERREAEKVGASTPEGLAERRAEIARQREAEAAEAARRREAEATGAARRHVAEAAEAARQQAEAERARQEAAEAARREDEQRRAEQAAALAAAQRLLVPGCRAAIAAEMGRDPRTMTVTPQQEGVVLLQYRRPDDATLWRVVCRIGPVSGNDVDIEWASVREDGSVGRWRVDGRYDDRHTVRVEGQNLVLNRRYASGETVTRRFAMADLSGPAASRR